MAKQNWQAKGAAPPKPVKQRQTKDASKKPRILPAATASVVLLGLLLLAFWGLIQFLDPVTPARLLLLTSTANSPGLPVNASAGPNARLLMSQSVVDTMLASAEPAPRMETLAAIRGIQSHEPRTLTLLPGRATTTLVYVNATGVVVTDSSGARVPGILPSDANLQAPIADQIIPLTDIVTALTESEADRRILVLDCESSESTRAVEDLSGSFVETASEFLQQMPTGQLDGLFVLFSSSPGERTWPWPSLQESIFGHFFARGIAGDADDDDDERVSLPELVEYVTQNVGSSARRLCHARQSPFLLDFDRDDSDFSLASVTRRGFGRAATVTEQTTRAIVLAGLQKSWQRYFSSREARSPVISLSPGRWRRIEDKLLLAESQFRGGLLTDADITLRDVTMEFDSMAERHARWHQLTAPTVMTMLSMPGAFGDAAAANETEPKNSSDLVADVLAERTKISDALEQLANTVDGGSALADSDQQLLKLMSASRRGAMADTLTDEHVQLLQTRRAAEIASAPRHFGSAAWIQPLLLAADVERRKFEDRYFTKPSTAVLTGTSASQTPSVSYDDVIEVEATMSEAFALRDRLLSELPWWIRYVNLRYRSDESDIIETTVTAGVKEGAEVSQDAEPQDSVAPERPTADLIDDAEDLVNKLATETAALSDLLLTNPSTLSSEDRLANVDRVNRAVDAARSTYDVLSTRLSEFSRDLDDERLWPPSGERWRRVTELLTLPFACSAVDAAVEDRPLESTALRLRLLEKTLIAAPEQKEGGTPDSDTQNETPRPVPQNTEQLAKLRFTRARLNLLPLPPADAPLPSADATDADWRFWFEDVHQKLRTLAGNPADTWDDAVRADLAFRLASPANFSATVLSPTTSIGSRIYSLHLLKQALRAADDFYASTVPGQEHYFLRVAKKFQKSAQDIYNARDFLEAITSQDTPTDADTDDTVSDFSTADADYSEASRVLRQRLDSLQSLLKTCRLTSDPEAVLFRAVSETSVTFGLTNGKQLPAGRAAIHVLPKERVDRALTGPDKSSAEFSIIRPDDNENTAAPLEAFAFFRGHEFRSAVRDVVVDELSGTSYVYRQQNTGPARLSVQPQKISERPLQLLFVLDCSLSMSFEDGKGAPRIRSVSRILQRFAEYASLGNLDAGVRLFGHRIADIDDPDAHTDTEKVLNIGTFARSRVDRILPLRPTGHSPIFNALIAGRADFPQTEADVRREMILVSDGADNWAQAGESPGVKELRSAFADGTIRVHTIGYNVDRFADQAQLQAIAAAGNGRFVAVSDADELLDEVVGLAGLPGYRVLQNDKVVIEKERLEPGAAAETLPPGNYVLEIRGGNDDVITQRTFRALPGESHRFAYDSGSLTYEENPKRTALATAGGDDRPELYILSAQRQDDALNLEFGLLAADSDRKPLLPISATISATISAAGSNAEPWKLVNVPPNSSSRHFPAWKVTIENWPQDADAAAIQVHWNQGVDQSIPVNPDWESPQRETTVGSGIRLVRQSREVAREGVSRFTLTFVFDEFGPGVRSWSVVPRTPVGSLRHIYQPEVGVYSVQFSMKDGTTPKTVDFIRMYRDPAADVLEASASLGIQKINN